MHSWADFEDQLRKLAVHSFHTIDPKPRAAKKLNNRESLQRQFQQILQEVVLLKMRPEL